MNRQEVLHGLNNAVTLFRQQEALSQEYEQVQQKDRPYEQKRKIGWLGIIVLGFEIYYVGMVTLSLLYNTISGNTEDIEFLVLVSMIGIPVIITTYLLLRMRNVKRNKWVDKENIKIKELKKAIEIRKKEIKGEYAEVQKRIDRYLGDWYPEGYEKSYIAAFFYQVLENGRARTLGDAINLYEEECYRRRQSEENAQILNELERQSFKQNVQIAQSMAETAALSAQLATANKQLADMKKELAELKRGDPNRR